MVGDSTPSANATGTSGKFARPLPTLSSRNRSPLQITRNEYNTYLVTNDSNELSDVLRNAQKREREREREREKVFRQSVSLEVEHEGKNQHVMRLTDRNGTHNPKINIRKRAVGTNGSESMVEESIGSSDAAADGRRLPPNLPWCVFMFRQFWVGRPRQKPYS